MPLVSLLTDTVSSTTTSLIEKILSNCGQYIKGFQTVGVGIASIFLLIIIFFYLSAILEGGKFQTKMLLPVLIYLCICNFQWVSKPVTAFITKLQYTCSSKIEDLTKLSLDGITDGYFKKESSYSILQGEDADSTYVVQRSFKGTLFQRGHTVTGFFDKLSCTKPMDAFLYNKYKGDKVDYFRIAVKRNMLPIAFGGISGIIPVLAKSAWEAKKWETDPESLQRSIDQEKGVKLMYGGNPGLYMFTNDGYNHASFNLKGFILMIFQWACDIVEFMLMMLGAVMVGVIVAFGPITWAFALFPGNGKFIVSWFLRMCQFALYSPIAVFIKGIGILAFCNLSETPGARSFVMVFGALLCIIVALTAVPSIASMIIEGASGAISLSQGIQSITSATSAASALALAPAKAVAGVAGIVTGKPGLAAAGLGAAGGFAAGGGKGGGGGASSSGQAGGTHA